MPGMFDDSVFLNLHLFYGILIFPRRCHAAYESGRQKIGCGCPPSFMLGLKKTENGILGIKQEKAADLIGCFSHVNGNGAYEQTEKT